MKIDEIKESNDSIACCNNLRVKTKGASHENNFFNIRYMSSLRLSFSTPLIYDIAKLEYACGSEVSGDKKHTTCSHNNLLLSRENDVCSPHPYFFFFANL